MPKTFDLEPLGGFDIVREALRNAMDGDCTKALEMAQFLKPGGQNPERLASEINVIPTISLHMQDRALCASFNPEWGTRYFESFIRDIVPKARENTELAWRYWHGFGAALDREKARTFFDIGLLADFSRYDHPYFETLTPVLGYPLPDYARRIAGWIKERLAVKDSRIRFLVDLAKGGGSTLPPDRPPQANSFVSSILLPTTKSAEAQYQHGC